MSDIIEYYAKSENGKYSEPLLAHLLKTLDNAEDLIEGYKIASPELQQAIKIASAFHDIGKADYRFQKYLISNESKPIIFHPLLGLSVIDEIASSLGENIKSLIVLAVASHHTALHQDLYSQVEEDDESQTLQIKNIPYFEKIVCELINRIGIDPIDVANCFSKRCMLVLRQAKYNFLPSCLI